MKSILLALSATSLLPGFALAQERGLPPNLPALEAGVALAAVAQAKYVLRDLPGITAIYVGLCENDWRDRLYWSLPPIPVTQNNGRTGIIVAFATPDAARLFAGVSLLKGGNLLVRDSRGRIRFHVPLCAVVLPPPPGAGATARSSIGTQN